MKQKVLSILALLLVAVTGAWTQSESMVYISEVAIADLKVGDILAEGATITGNKKDEVYLDGNRAKKNNEIITSNASLIVPVNIGANGAIPNGNDGYTPITDDGKDGDAWVVTKIVNISELSINVSGILMPAPPSTSPGTTRRRPARSRCPPAT